MMPSNKHVLHLNVDHAEKQFTSVPFQGINELYLLSHNIEGSNVPRKLEQTGCQISEHLAASVGYLSERLGRLRP